MSRSAFIGVCLGLACAAWPLAGASVYVPEPSREACRLWNDLEQKVRRGQVAAKQARAEFRGLWPMVRVDEVPSPRQGRWQWVFPLPGYGFKDIAKKSYKGAGYSYYDGPKRQGHPAIDIFVRDHDRNGLDDRDNKPIPVVSAMDGVVVAAQSHWSPQDTDNPEGVYVCVLDQEDGRFFVYARLARLKVSVGQLVSKGQVVGWVGRSGADVARGMRTHLHFQVHDFADGRFYTLNPLHSLRVAKHLTWPLPEPEYGGGPAAGRKAEPKGMQKPEALP